MSTFRPDEPDQQLLLPLSLRDWLPPDHLVWFISETVDRLDLCASDAGALVPMVEQARRAVGRLPAEVLADAGYASEANLQELEQHQVKGYVALGREGRRTHKRNPQAHATRRMARRLRSKRGRSRYKRRKHIAEPPFGWIKRGLGFWQFSLRGLSRVTGEFKLVCLAMNLRRMRGMIAWE
jgi:IS5 family transposase